MLFGPEGPLNEQRPFEIESIWAHRGRLIFKFHGVDGISDAELLRGAEMRVPRSDRMELPAGEYYHSDLVGCVVKEKGTGQMLGRVRSWLEGGEAGLLDVEEQETGREILIPFTRSICVEIDVEAGRIVADLPEGLKELNG